VRDEHVGGAPHAGRLGPQQRPERARPAQQRAHALHHLRLRLARAGAAAATGRRAAAACARARHCWYAARTHCAVRVLPLSRSAACVSASLSNAAAAAGCCAAAGRRPAAACTRARR
jgi:hypothetical protein